MYSHVRVETHIWHATVYVNVYFETCGTYVKRDVHKCGKRHVSMGKSVYVGGKDLSEKKLYNTATHCNRLQQTATDCNRLQQTAEQVTLLMYEKLSIRREKDIFESMSGGTLYSSPLYTHTNTCKYAHTHTHTHTRTNTHAHTNTHTQTRTQMWDVCANIRVYEYTHACVCVCVCVMHVRACVNVCAQVCVYVCMCKYVQDKYQHPMRQTFFWERTIMQKQPKMKYDSKVRITITNKIYPSQQFCCRIIADISNVVKIINNTAVRPKFKYNLKVGIIINIRPVHRGSFVAEQLLTYKTWWR